MGIRKSFVTRPSQFVLTVFFLVLFSQIAYCGTYGGGAGTAEEPFLISTAEHMQEIGANEGHWNKHFILTVDISLSAYTGTSFNIIGMSWDGFEGVFDGNGYTISNFTYVTTAGGDIGLFSKVGLGGKVMNLGLTDVNVAVGSGWFAGSLSSRNIGTITNCYATGSVSGDRWVGGLVGSNSKFVTNCYFTGSVSGDERIGGLAGENSSIIMDCFATCSVSGNSKVGGLVGRNIKDINNSYAECTVSGGIIAGGLVGENRREITNCYAASSVSGVSYVGGLTGINHEGSHFNCFWNVSLNPSLTGIGNDDDPVNVMSRTTAEMKTASTYINYGWDFAVEAANGTLDNWYMPSGSYPLLSWQGSVGIVPETAGLSQAEAEALIRSAGPGFIIKPTYSDTVAEGNVISTEPSAGSEASIVTVFVSIPIPYEAGSGTESDPYQIWTAEQMNAIGANLEDLDKHFVLMADIDLSEYTGKSFNIIGISEKSFEGVFDGNGHTISNFTYVSTVDSYVGLFGIIGSVGQIKDLGVIDAYVDIDGYSAGSLAGFNNGSITNCYATGSVDGDRYAGGLVGSNWTNGTITNCYSSCTVFGRESVGGLVGSNLYDSTITNSYATCSVSGEEKVGGLVGYLSENSTITNSYAACNVSGEDKIGSFVGETIEEATIINCYSVGITNGIDNVGNFAGFSDSSVINAGCFVDIDVCGFSNNFGNTGNSAGVVNLTSAEMQSESTFTDMNWDFVGESVNGNEDYWYMPACGYPLLSWQRRLIIPDTAGLSQTAAENLLRSTGSSVFIIQTGSVAVEPGHVISQVPEAGCEGSFATLYVSKAFAYGAGNGTEISPYEIWTAEQMNTIGIVESDWDSHFILMANIDLGVYAGTAYNIIGNEAFPFSGVFDGGGHVISNLTIASGVADADYLGLFGYADTRAEIKNLGVVNVDISSSGDSSSYVGGLIGYANASSITNCYSSGRVSGDENVGGLVGYQYGDYSDADKIINCYSTCKVFGSKLCGGLAGFIRGTIEESFATGDVNGHNEVGGLVGFHIGSARNCYATGTVSGNEDVGSLAGHINGSYRNCYAVGKSTGNDDVGGLVGLAIDTLFFDCFWNSEVNAGLKGVGSYRGIGLPGTPTGVYGRTTALMQLKSTYTDKGWDFVGEDVNGGADVWRMCLDGVGYPRLAWEFDLVGDFDCPDGVGVEDLGFLAERWLEVDVRGDLNGDGIVDMGDYAIFAEFWVEGE